MDEYIEIFDEAIIDKIVIQAENDIEIVKSILTISDNNIIERIVKLYNYNYSKEEDPIKSRRIVKQLFTIARSEYGEDFLKHLVKYGAYTDLELERVYGIRKQTANHIRKNLISLKLHEPEQIVKFGNPNPRKSGPKPGIWTRIDCTEEQIIDAERRYYSITERKSSKRKSYAFIIDQIINFLIKQGISETTFSELRTQFQDIVLDDLREACQELNKQKRGYVIYV